MRKYLQVSSQCSEHLPDIPLIYSTLYDILSELATWFIRYSIQQKTTFLQILAKVLHFTLFYVYLHYYVLEHYLIYYYSIQFTYAYKIFQEK